MNIEERYPVPVRTNTIIVLICSSIFVLLFWLAGTTSDTWLRLLYGVLFGITMIPIYSLIHEAEHGQLFSNKWGNQFMGRWLCMLFIVSFSFFRHCHLKHHKKNRTDEEMWDLYYEHQVKWKRFGNLYLMMIGFGYLALWLSVILFAFAPSFIRSKFLRSHNEINGFLNGSDDNHKLLRTRLESLSVIAFQALVLWWMNWNWVSWLVLYLVHGFIWSSQNYVNHAFSPRDIINGAHNLKMPFWLRPIYLNFNVHLAHHQHPNIPWIYLPKFIRKGSSKFAFHRNYLRLWKGPEPTPYQNSVEPTRAEQRIEL